MDEEEFNMKRTNTILYLVVPCYNEEEVLHKSAAVLLDKLDRLIQAGTISDKSKIYLSTMAVRTAPGRLFMS